VLSDWKELKIDDDASLVTYLFKMPGTSQEGERHSTIWTGRDGKWLARFHHGTPATKEPAMPAATTASPTAAASPRASASPK
jgi:hypothetical protein